MVRLPQVVQRQLPVVDPVSTAGEAAVVDLELILIIAIFCGKSVKVVVFTLLHEMTGMGCPRAPQGIVILSPTERWYSWSEIILCKIIFPKNDKLFFKKIITWPPGDLRRVLYLDVHDL